MLTVSTVGAVLRVELYSGVCIAGCRLVPDGAKNGGIQEPSDTDLDLSEADFAPTHCSVLLKPSVINGSEPDDRPTMISNRTVVDGSSVPPSIAQHVADGGGDVSGAGTIVHNGESTSSVSVRYDAIGLPVYMEHVEMSDYCEPVPATAYSDNCNRSQHSAVGKMNTSSDSHLMKHDPGGSEHMASSANSGLNDVLSAGNDAVSASISADSRQAVISGDGEQLDSSLMRQSQSQRNITSNSMIQVPDAGCVDIPEFNSSSRLDASGLKCAANTDIQLMQQNVEDMKCDVNETRQNVIDELQDDYICSDAASSLASQTVNESHTEQLVRGDGSSQTVRETDGTEPVTAAGCAGHLSPSMKSDHMDDIDSSVDEVDKTVSISYNLHSTVTSEHDALSHETVAVSHETDYSLQDTERPVVGSKCSEKEADETCSIDRVERITSCDVARSRMEVTPDRCSDVVSARKDESDVECGLESNTVINIHETVDVDEMTGFVTEPVLHETAGDAVDTPDGSVPVQSHDSDDITLSCPVSLSVVDNAAVTDADDIGLPSSQLQPTDAAEEKICDVLVPAAESQHTDDISERTSNDTVDTDESSQQHITEEMCASEMHVEPDVKDAVEWDNLVNDGGDAQSLELCQKPSEPTRQEDHDSLPTDVNGSLTENRELSVASDSVTMDSELAVSGNETLSAEAVATKLSTAQSSGISVNDIDVLAAHNTIASFDSDVPQVSDSTAADKQRQQEHCECIDTSLSGDSGESTGQLDYDDGGKLLSVDDAVDNGFGVDTSNITAHAQTCGDQAELFVDSPADIQTNETGDTSAESRMQLTDDDLLIQQLQERKTELDEDAERWFNEQFAACEEFDVDEFVSSAWSEFHQNAQLPAVGNIHDEILHHSTAAGTSDTGEYECSCVDTGDSWHHVEHAAVTANAVDDSLCPSSSDLPSSELSQYVDGELDISPCYSTSSTEQPPVQQTTLLTPPPPGNLRAVNYYVVWSVLTRLMPSVL